MSNACLQRTGADDSGLDVVLELGQNEVVHLLRVLLEVEVRALMGRLPLLVEVPHACTCLGLVALLTWKLEDDNLWPLGEALHVKVVLTADPCAGVVLQGTLARSGALFERLRRQVWVHILPCLLLLVVWTGIGAHSAVVHEQAVSHFFVHPVGVQHAAASIFLTSLEVCEALEWNGCHQRMRSVVLDQLPAQSRRVEGPWVWPLRRQLVCLGKGREAASGRCVRGGGAHLSHIIQVCERTGRLEWLQGGQGWLRRMGMLRSGMLRSACWWK